MVVPCLSEIEAMALMILAVDCQRPLPPSDLVAGTAGYLADLLRVRLTQIQTEPTVEPGPADPNVAAPQLRRETHDE
jgi:hypothetical protein